MKKAKDSKPAAKPKPEGLANPKEAKWAFGVTRPALLAFCFAVEKRLTILL